MQTLNKTTKESDVCICLELLVQLRITGVPIRTGEVKTPVRPEAEETHCISGRECQGSYSGNRYESRRSVRDFLFII